MAQGEGRFQWEDYEIVWEEEYAGCIRCLCDYIDNSLRLIIASRTSFSSHSSSSPINPHHLLASQ